jgi:hypothetical protein
MTSPWALRRIEQEIGELIAEHDRAEDLSRFEQYADDPEGFVREVLKADPWGAQVTMMELVRDSRQVVVRSANGIGKDWAAARLALWWVYARGGFVLVTGPTERQVKAVVMGEVRRAFDAAQQLPGTLYELALRADASGRRGILSFTSNQVSKLTGFHAPRLMIVVTEAQGIEGPIWEGIFANATGADGRLVVVGNPLSSSGRFFEFCRSDTWVAQRITAFEHPNVIEQREVIPGAVTQQFIDNMAAEYGKGSGVYVSRVEGDFPDTDEDTICKRSWIEAAERRWTDNVFEEAAQHEPVVLALDPARFGADHTALVIRQGRVVREIVTWAKADLMVTVGKVLTELDRLELDRERTQVLVDTVGLGSGVFDRLKEQGVLVSEFNAGKTARDATKFRNVRAECYWRLRRAFEEGTIAVPPDEKLKDELAATQWKPNSAGKIEIEPKDDLRARIGRSPDRADALAMTFHAALRGPLIVGPWGNRVESLRLHGESNIPPWRAFEERRDYGPGW